jgi:glycine cleavage system H protein
MSNVPADFRYTKDHEWARLESDGTVRIGITDHAQKQLGDVVYVELPDVGSRFEVNEPCASIESVKAVSEIYCPASGTVSARNDRLDAEPDLVNEDPYGEGWIFTIRPDSGADYNLLLDAAAYTAYLADEE